MVEVVIAQAVQIALKELYDFDIEVNANSISCTKREFVGDFTVTVFPYVKAAKKAPEVVGDEIGKNIRGQLAHFTTPSGKIGELISYNVIKGFLNLSINPQFWMQILDQHLEDDHYGFGQKDENNCTLIEYSSPNTNKPLHLGHIRNNLLGSSVAKIVAAAGKKVVKVNLVNDRGIHICKSMLSWQKYGNGETPETNGLKGDHLVGKYYVLFDQHYKAQIADLTAAGSSLEEATRNAPLILEAQEMLRQWEEGNSSVRELWKMMNSWVYAGFAETYQRLGIEFDKTYYESETYLLGKQLVEEGVQTGAFIRKEDNSVWVDLSDEGLDEKLLLRSDGTSVYMTQDLGTARMRYETYHPEKMVYVVGNEQDYHFQVLQLVLDKKLHKTYGKKIFHLSYGMVELPQGKMKSREGTVVDADDLMSSMYEEAKKSTESLGKHEFEEAEAQQLYETIGLGALKYFILKVDPKKNMLFNPEESIDFNGNTAPFLQYTYARIASLLRKAKEQNIDPLTKLAEIDPGEQEISLLHNIYDFPQVIEQASESLSPALVANYVFDLAKEFNRFYQEFPIFKEENAHKQLLRLKLSKMTANTLKIGLALLGIEVPERM